MMDLDLDIPDPTEPRPLGDDRCVFIRPVLATGSKVVAGEYSYYDASEDAAGELHSLRRSGPSSCAVPNSHLFRPHEQTGGRCGLAVGCRYCLARRLGANRT